MKSFWYRKKWLAVAGHCLFWILLFFAPFLFEPNNHSQKNPVAVRFMWLYVINVVLWMGLFYFNAVILIPALVNLKKYKLYLLSLFLTVVMILCCSWIAYTLIIPKLAVHGQVSVLFNVFPCLFMIASSTAYKMIKERLEQERQEKDRETEYLKTELSFLRSQVSPHFMFNVLNNMVALARKKSDDLEQSLIKLSSLLRYMLYETNTEKVLLDREIEYLESYIDLQKQRFGNKVRVSFMKEIPDGSSYMIEAMLLIPFVENAFKHGTGMLEDAFIEISLRVVKGILYFSVINRYDKESIEEKDRTSGIGIPNVTRRLALLYKDRHVLEINPVEDRFVTNLQLNLY